jgi:hypothetical protein
VQAWLTPFIQDAVAVAPTSIHVIDARDMRMIAKKQGSIKGDAFWRASHKLPEIRKVVERDRKKKKQENFIMTLGKEPKRMKFVMAGA